MLNKQLMTLLRAEQDIYKTFSSHRNISKEVVAFWSPGSNQVPHWNTLYPSSFENAYTEVELALASELYKSNGLTGHLMSLEKRSSARFNEVAEYFAFESGESHSDKERPFVSRADSMFTLNSSQDLPVFVGVVSEVFGLNKVTQELFFAKMQLLSQRRGSKFWVMSYDREICGALSTFMAADGSHFMFNVAVLPKFQKIGLGAEMIRFCASQSGGALYTYSHNPHMRESLLPKSGFTSVGTVYLYPLDDSEFDPTSIYRGTP